MSWANELAKRGYAVLVHDAFAFASRRVRDADLPEVIRKGKKEVKPESEAEIKAYNTFAGEHEHIMAKSLFCAGMTWPGVFTAEDQRALDSWPGPTSTLPASAARAYPGAVCAPVYLAGLDERIACACCVGMMTTWRDYLLNKSYTHTWMVYIPGLPDDLDYPEILGLRVPRPTMVLNDIDDGLFTIDEMRRADRMLGEVFAKAGAADRYKCVFYPGPHNSTGRCRPRRSPGSTAGSKRKTRHLCR